MYTGTKITDLSVERRIFEFAVMTMCNGKKEESALKYFGLVYRKGKTVKDILHMKRLSFNESNSISDAVDGFAKRLDRVLKTA